MITGLALVLGWCWADAVVGQDRSEGKTVQAESFVVRDSEGRIRAELGLEESTPVLKLYDERGVVIFRDEDVVHLRAETRALKETIGLMGVVPVEGGDEDIAALQEEIRALKETISLLGAVPVVEEEIPLLPEDLEELPEEESGRTEWGDVVGVMTFLLVVFGILFLLLRAGMHWGERRVGPRWEYIVVEDADEERIQALIREGWEYLGVREEEKDGEKQAIHSFRRIRATGSGGRGVRKIPIVFFVAGVGAIMVGIGSHLALFVDPPSVLIVGLGALLFTLAHFSLREVVGAVQCALGRQEIEPEEGLRARLVFRTMENYVLGLGALGFFIGLVIMLKNMDDPAAIGPGMALALLTITYAIGLAKIVITPLELRVARRLSEEPQPALAARGSGGQQGLFLIVMVALMGIVTFLSLLVSFS